MDYRRIKEILGEGAANKSLILHGDHVCSLVAMKLLNIKRILMDLEQDDFEEHYYFQIGFISAALELLDCRLSVDRLLEQTEIKYIFHKRQAIEKTALLYSISRHRVKDLWHEDEKES